MISQYSAMCHIVIVEVVLKLYVREWQPGLKISLCSFVAMCDHTLIYLKKVYEGYLAAAHCVVAMKTHSTRNKYEKIVT